MKQLTQGVGIIALALAFQAAVAGDIKPVDSIVAVVDNAVITRQDLSNAVNQIQRQQPKGSKADQAALQQQALLQLVNQSLLVQAAQRSGLSVSEAEIDAEVARIAQAQKLTVAQLYQRVAKEGANRSALRRTIANNLLAQNMQKSITMEQSRVSDAEVDAAIARAQQQGLTLPEGVTSHQYHVQHILIKDDTEASRKLINQLQKQARSGTAFAQLARRYSQDGSAAQGGDLGWIAEGQTVAPFEAAVKALQPGQVSQPVRSQFGWHIIRLVEIKSADTPQERLRNGMRAALSEEKSAQALQNTLRQLHEQAFIQVR
ncbi:peptidylprolyl isomerase [Paralysiella testudinis]|uniref:Peptidylprolyl isomerase n=1 Tax=Paralysiella testudinis TaxID=2809020 RepID=A0A892ZK36_9NEIS|nr:peptidylprolyl isomerase [Paralysiella testudinis]QRQ82788.1 peptidylprolyl isomerase [Paralysiella testudinis]